LRGYCFGQIITVPIEAESIYYIVKWNSAGTVCEEIRVLWYILGRSLITENINNSWSIGDSGCCVIGENLNPAD